MSTKKKKPGRVRVAVDGYYPASVITAEQARKCATKVVEQEELERALEQNRELREARLKVPELLEHAFDRIRDAADEGQMETRVEFSFSDRTLHQVSLVAEELRKLGFAADIDQAGSSDQYRVHVKWSKPDVVRDDP